MFQEISSFKSFIISYICIALSEHFKAIWTSTRSWERCRSRNSTHPFLWVKFRDFLGRFRFTPHLYDSYKTSRNRLCCCFRMPLFIEQSIGYRLSSLFVQSKRIWREVVPIFNSIGCIFSRRLYVIQVMPGCRSLVITLCRSLLTLLWWTSAHLLLEWMPLSDQLCAPVSFTATTLTQSTMDTKAWLVAWYVLCCLVTNLVLVS